MKIALFYKSYIIKTSSLFILISLISGVPLQANAGFFDLFTGKSSMAEVIGIESNNDTDNKVVYNSQNMILPEPFLNPDMNKVEIASAVTIVEGEALSSENRPLKMDPASDLEKNASSVKINVYTVKKGDTLKSIAKRFKVPESTIVYSNTDIKKENLLKVGQVLAILPVKSVSDSQQDKTADKTTKVVPAKKIVVENNDKPIETKKEVETPVVEKAEPEVAVEKQAVVEATPAVDLPKSEGQPSGTIVGNYIWPFASGVGRVSQGIHADQAYDFAAPANSSLYAIQSGTVLIAHPTGYNGGYGHYVVINFEDGRQAIFGHMNKVVVSAGDVVKQGDLIGYVGSTGKSTGPHVHIGFRGSLSNPYLGLKVNSRDLETND